jgi:hypothetical protein
MFDIQGETFPRKMLGMTMQKSSEEERIFNRLGVTHGDV